jgi:hypothetical protein
MSLKFLLAISLLQISRSHEHSSYDVTTLLGSPDVLIIDGTPLRLGASVWRDFMPVNPREGSPLIAGCWLCPTSLEDIDDCWRKPRISIDFPVLRKVFPEELWVIHGSDVWSSVFFSKRRRRII